MNFLMGQENLERSVHIKNMVQYNLNHLVYSQLIDSSDPVEKETVDSFKDFKLIKEFIPFDFKNYFKTLKKWVCVITKIDENVLIARAEEVGFGDTYEEVEFDLNDIPEDDSEFLVVGSVFYWSIGWEYRKGQKIKESIIRFQRLATWRQEDYDDAIELSKDLASNLNWEKNDG